MKSFFICLVLISQIFGLNLDNIDSGFVNKDFDADYGIKYRNQHYEIAHLRRRISELEKEFAKLPEPIDRNSSFCTNINPCIGARYDVGEPNVQWRDGYFADNVNAGGNLTSQENLLFVNFAGQVLSNLYYANASCPLATNYTFCAPNIKVGGNSSGVVSLTAGVGIDLTGTPGNPVVNIANTTGVTTTCTYAGGTWNGQGQATSIVCGATPIPYVGAKCNGIADDTAVIQAALTLAYQTGGGAVELPPGRCKISSALQIGSNTTLTGQGVDVTIVLLANGSNCNLIQTLAATTSHDDMENFEIRDLTLNGNWLGQTGTPTNISNNCIYSPNGQFFRLNNLKITNCLGNCIYSDGLRAFPHEQQSTVRSIEIDTCGLNGILWFLPSDSYFSNIVIIGASALAEGGADGIQVHSGNHFIYIHPYHAGGPHMRYDMNMVATGSRITNSDFEGGLQLMYIGGKDAIIESTRFYAPMSNKTAVTIAGDYAQLVDCQWQDDVHSNSYPIMITITNVAETTTSTSVGGVKNYRITGQILTSQAQPMIDFVNDGGGEIDLQIRNAGLTITPYTGTPSLSTRLSMYDNDNVASLFASVHLDPLGINVDPSSGYNTWSGYLAGSSITTASFLTLYGTNAGKKITTGVGNQAFGYEALQSCTTGTYNLASGYQALNALTTGSSNTCGGTEACSAATTAAHNTGWGYYVLKNLTVGTYNTAVGEFAGVNCINSSYTTFVGQGTGILVSDSSNVITYSTAVGACATITGSNQFQVGCANAPEGIYGYSYATIPSYAGTGSVNFTLGASTMVGTGANVSCATNYVCDSVFGTLTLNTGTSITLAGQVLIVNTGYYRQNYMTCMIQLFATGDTTAHSPTWTENQYHWVLVVQTALSSSTAYTIKYHCGGM